MQRVRTGQRRVWLAFVAVIVLLVGAHAALEVAVAPDLDPLIYAIDAGTALVLVLAFTLYLRWVARERRREAIERLLLDLLSVPRNIEATATETLKALAEARLGEAMLVAIAGDGDRDGALRPVATHGYPRGWAAQSPPPPERLAERPELTHPKAQHAWLEPAASRVGKRPWVAEVPLRSGPDALGVLWIVARRPGVLKDATVLGLLSTRLGAAFDHAALYEAAYARERDLEGLETRRREFMAAIAHEIRTPLTSIQAFADLLQMGQGEMDETAGQLVTSLGQGVMRLSSLVNDLIDLGRAGQASYAFQRDEVDLGAVVRSAEATLRPALMLREQSVELDLPPEGPVVRTDRRVMEQVTLNLISNANRHGPPGGAIAVTLRTTSDGGARLEVVDNGPGIPEVERERIFQPYYRIAKDTGVPVPGSGLGLAVARQLLDQCGGRIWVEADPEGGARFCVELRANGG
ncbi:MAG: HAMP domain-containing histidine kinase [Dehalococcoidia bacterium]|nr:HAMP domain-containing histidine kinase [Dehalococcoidia bacterium]